MTHKPNSRLSHTYSEPNKNQIHEKRTKHTQLTTTTQCEKTTQNTLVKPHNRDRKRNKTTRPKTPQCIPRYGRKQTETNL
jgi:hypothetical protein